MSEGAPAYDDPGEVLGSFLAGHRIIAYYSILGEIGGSANAGVFLSQLMYWSPRSAADGGWVYKTRPEWERETNLSAREVDTARRHWKGLGILEESQPQGTDRTLFYRINYLALSQAVSRHENGNAFLQSTMQQNESQEASKNADVPYHRDYLQRLPTESERTPTKRKKTKFDWTDWSEIPEEQQADLIKHGDAQLRTRHLQLSEPVHTWVAEQVNFALAHVNRRKWDHTVRYLQGWLNRACKDLDLAPPNGYQGRSQVLPPEDTVAKLHEKWG